MFFPQKRLFPFRILAMLALLASLLPFCQSAAEADTVQYFYDELGRLTQVINGSTITDYAYDEVGNILSVTNGSLTDTPSVTAMAPNALLVGMKTAVVFTGQNLLSATKVSSVSGNTLVNDVAVTPNAVTVMLTAQSEGADTIKITFSDNSQTVYQSDITAYASAVVISPPVTVIPPASSGTASVSLNPPLNVPISVKLKTDNIPVATVQGVVTIPPGGTAPVQFATNAVGAAIISSLNNVPCGYVVSEIPASGNGVSSSSVSVSIDPTPRPIGTSTTGSSLVSVATTLLPKPIAPSSTAASPVSVSIAPTPKTIGPSATVAPKVSVTISH